MLPTAFTRMFLIKPGSNPLGQPGITASSAAASDNTNVNSALLAEAIFAKSSCSRFMNTLQEKIGQQQID